MFRRAAEETTPGVPPHPNQFLSNVENVLHSEASFHHTRDQVRGAVFGGVFAGTFITAASLLKITRGKRPKGDLSHRLDYPLAGILGLMLGVAVAADDDIITTAQKEYKKFHHRALGWWAEWGDQGGPTPHNDKHPPGSK